jgi:polyribonucleotide nucleotidyltransferase
VDGKLLCNPTSEMMDKSDLDLIVAGSRDAIVMVEGGAKEIYEEDMLAAILFAHKEMQVLLDMQEELQAKCGKEKWAVTPPEKDEALEGKVRELAQGQLSEAITISDKLQRYARFDEIKKDVEGKVVPEGDDTGMGKKVGGIFGSLKGELMRTMVLKEKRRIDGRDLTTVRPIVIDAGVLPRTHGSALFTRGETQALVTTTLGTSDDQQLIDHMAGGYYKRFMLHYNFPPFCVGEVKFLRSPGRREIGHGALAERALQQVLPDEEGFPYTVRIVSEILESNGSSSMATVCGGSLALMDAGVPIKAPVAGVAMGLIKEGSDCAILTDILGDEDHLGDMDFKVAGTKHGVTALQMDIKCSGLSEAIMRDALQQAHGARMHILGEMDKALPEARAELSEFAPKIATIKIDKEKIGALIGPGGKMIRGIQAQTGAKLDVEEDGTVHIAAIDQQAGDEAMKMVKAVTATPEVGKYYRGIVQRTVDFGAFVEILPGTDGLVHISQLENKRVNEVTDIIKEGDEVLVKVIEIDPKNGKIRLSRKEALEYTGDVENS